MNALTPQMSWLQQENERLRLRNEELEETLAALKSTFREESFKGRSLGLTCLQLDMLRILLKRDVVSLRQFYDALYTGRLDPPSDEIIRVHVVHLRSRLKRFKIRIETVWGHGYRLSQAAKATLRQLDDSADLPAANVEQA